MVHTIGTYNMSFMSDLSTEIGPKMAFASEGAFLARLHGKAEERRSYWINAMNLLEDFLIKMKPSVVGLQEMNLTDKDSNSGTDAIDRMLDGTGYIQISRSVPTNNAGVSLIYHPAKVGEVKHVQCIDNVNQGGRPLLMLITELNGKNYLSVSIHGAQDPKLRLDKNAFNAYMVEKNKMFLESSAKAFLDSNGITNLAGIFIMGDFNDRYDGISEIKIGDKVASYSGVAPKSCCYNWDSSCYDDLEKYFGDSYATCKVPDDNAEIMNPVSGKLSLPGERGATKNYRYAGDKVFGFNPETHLAIYRPKKEGWDGISTESDHELVYASFNENTSGGRRKRKTRNAKSRSKKLKTRSKSKSRR